MLLLLSVYAIVVGVSKQFSAMNLDPLVHFSVLFFFLLLLSVNEGFQVAALRIQNMCPHEIGVAFPRAAKVHSLLYPSGSGHVKSRLKQLFIGQSFCVVLSTFVIAQCTTFGNFDPSYALDSRFLSSFLASGFPGVFFTVCVAQLTPSLISKLYPCHFLDLPGVYTVIQVALLLEASGLLYFTYLFVDVIERAACMSSPLSTRGAKKSEVDATSSYLVEERVESEENGAEANYALPSLCSRTVTLMKAATSSCIFVAAFSFLVYSLVKGYSSSLLPVLLQAALLVLALVTVFYFEGLKIAIVSRTEDISSLEPKAAEDSDSSATMGENVVNLLREQPQGVERFLLGRQQLVVPCGFVVAQITSFTSFPSKGMSQGLYFIVVVFGLPAVLVLLQLSQLAPQLLAEGHGKMFLSLPGAFSFVYSALCVEKLGVVSIVFLFLGKISTETRVPEPVAYEKATCSEGATTLNPVAAAP